MTDARSTDTGDSTGPPVVTLHPVSPPSGDSPETREFKLPGRDDETLWFRGRLLGFGTSQREAHTHLTTSQPHAAPGARCSACRWFEVRVFAVESELVDGCTCGAPVHAVGAPHEPFCGSEDPTARYLVLTAGRTVVPGETEMRRAGWTNSPFEVVELLTQRKRASSFIPTTSTRALAQAAYLDAGLRDAFINRKTA